MSGTEKNPLFGPDKDWNYTMWLTLYQLLPNESLPWTLTSYQSLTTHENKYIELSIGKKILD